MNEPNGTPLDTYERRVRELEEEIERQAKRLEAAERVLTAIKDGDYRAAHPLSGDYAEDGRYVWPGRINDIEQAAAAWLEGE